MIKIKDLYFSYDGKDILQKINLDISSGITAILGKNGAGKTTLLKCLAQLLRYSGEIFYRELNLKKLSLKKLAKILSYLPADIASIYDFSVKEIIAMGMYPTARYSEKLRQDILLMFDLKKFLDRPINTLSSGERQMVFLAQTFVQDTPIILLDEPTNHLDIWGRNKLFSIVNQLKKEKPDISVIFTTHNIEEALNHSDNFVFLHEQNVRFQGKPENVFSSAWLNDFRQHNQEIQAGLENLLKGGQANVS